MCACACVQGVAEVAAQCLHVLLEDKECCHINRKSKFILIPDEPVVTCWDEASCWSLVTFKRALMRPKHHVPLQRMWPGNPMLLKSTMTLPVMSFFIQGSFFLYFILKILWHHSVTYFCTFFYSIQRVKHWREKTLACDWKSIWNFPTCCSKANLLLINLLFRIRKPLPLAVTQKTLL